MPKPSREGWKAYNVELPEELAERVRKLGWKNGRSFRAEVVHALERHLESPPSVRVVVEVPALDAGQSQAKKRPAKRKTR
jgi:predicted DNA-binding protein